MKDKLELDESDYQLEPLVLINSEGNKCLVLDLIQYSGRFFKRKFYHFHLYRIQFSKACEQRLKKLETDGFNVWVSLEEIRNGRVEGYLPPMNAISETVQEVFERLEQMKIDGKKVIERLPHCN